MLALALALLSGCGGAKADAVPDTEATDDTDGTTDPVDSAPIECNADNEGCTPGLCPGNGPHMLPGSDCLACHRPDGDRDAPTWSVAGTVFADLDGSAPLEGATVHLVDAAGKALDLETNSAGNFYTGAKLAFPLRASVETASGTVGMADAPESGGCNACHACDGPRGGKLYGK